MKFSHLNIIITGSLVYFAGYSNINAKPPYQGLLEEGIRSVFSSHSRLIQTRHFATSRPLMITEGKKLYAQQLKNTSGDCIKKPNLKGIVIRLYSTAAQNPLETEQSKKNAHTNKRLGDILLRRERKLQLDKLEGNDWNQRFFELVRAGKISLLKSDIKPLDLNESLKEAIDYVDTNCLTSINTLGGDIKETLMEPLENLRDAFGSLLSCKKVELSELSRNRGYRESLDNLFWDFENALRNLDVKKPLSVLAKNELLFIKQNYASFKKIAANYLYSSDTNRINEEQITGISITQKLHDREGELGLDKLTGYEWNDKFFSLVKKGKIRLFNQETRPLDNASSLDEMITYAKNTCYISLSKIGGEIQNKLMVPFNDLSNVCLRISNYEKGGNKDAMRRLASDYHFVERLEQCRFEFAHALRNTLLSEDNFEVLNELLLVRAVFQKIELNAYATLYEVKPKETNNHQ